MAQAAEDPGEVPRRPSAEGVVLLAERARVVGAARELVRPGAGVLGATGDLTSRLLLPGLGRVLTEQPGRRITLVGAGLPATDDDRWTRTVREAIDTVEATGPALEHALRCGP